MKIGYKKPLLPIFLPFRNKLFLEFSFNMTRKTQLEGIIQQNRDIVGRFPGGTDTNTNNGPFQRDIADKIIPFFLKWNPDENPDFEIGYDHSFIFFRALLEHPCQVN